MDSWLLLFLLFSSGCIDLAYSSTFCAPLMVVPGDYQKETRDYRQQVKYLFDESDSVLIPCKATCNSKIILQWNKGDRWKDVPSGKFIHTDGPEGASHYKVRESALYRCLAKSDHGTALSYTYEVREVPKKLKGSRSVRLLRNFTFSAHQIKQYRVLRCGYNEAQHEIRKLAQYIRFKWHIVDQTSFTRKDEFGKLQDFGTVSYLTGTAVVRFDEWLFPRRCYYVCAIHKTYGTAPFYLPPLYDPRDDTKVFGRKNYSTPSPIELALPPFEIPKPSVTCVYWKPIFSWVVKLNNGKEENMTQLEANKGRYKLLSNKLHTLVFDSIRTGPYAGDYTCASEYRIDRRQRLVKRKKAQRGVYARNTDPEVVAPRRQTTISVITTPYPAWKDAAGVVIEQNGKVVKGEEVLTSGYQVQLVCNAVHVESITWELNGENLTKVGSKISIVANKDNSGTVSCIAKNKVGELRGWASLNSEPSRVVMVIIIILVLVCLVALVGVGSWFAWRYRAKLRELVDKQRNRYGKVKQDEGKPVGKVVDEPKKRVKATKLGEGLQVTQGISESSRLKSKAESSETRQHSESSKARQQNESSKTKQDSASSKGRLQSEPSKAKSKGESGKVNAEQEVARGPKKKPMQMKKVVKKAAR